MEKQDKNGTNGQVDDELIFGGCPECGANEWVNVYKEHYGICKEHKVYWPIGGNLFSNWRFENMETWVRNSTLLSQYTEVEPAYTWAEVKAHEPDVPPPPGWEDEAAPCLYEEGYFK